MSKGSGGGGHSKTNGGAAGAAGAAGSEDPEKVPLAHAAADEAAIGGAEAAAAPLK